MDFRAPFLIALIAFLSFGLGRADNLKLPGSTLKIDDVALRADAIFIGTILEIGEPTGASPEGGDYHGVQVKVQNTLKGSVGEQVSVSLYTLLLQEGRETPPKVRETYLFFVRNEPRHPSSPYTVLKLLPTTDDNIAETKKRTRV